MTPEKISGTVELLEFLRDLLDNGDPDEVFSSIQTDVPEMLEIAEAEMKELSESL